MPLLTRSKHYKEPLGSGPFEAIIVSHLDPAYMGTLQVELLKSRGAGNQPQETGQLVEARYLNPFYGVTPLSGTTKNDGYKNSQKSYGMWAVPPDVGTRVVVILLEGNIHQAFWIGCVQDEYMNFMVPGNPSTVYNDEFKTRVPTAEYNKKTATTAGNDPTKFEKPAHTEFVESLKEQGLLNDDIRGLTTSSARREVPSMVFGISTPGPVDKGIGAPRTKVGQSDSKANVFVNRLGGSSFVMDDGDDKIVRKGHASTTPQEYVNVENDETGGDSSLPSNELIRLKTRTGHQILLHNTEDLIYIGNARGTSWIELTSNGKIDIFAEDSISVHTEQDINYTADRDINFNAGNNINLNAGSNINLTSGFNTEIHVGADYRLYVKNNSDTIVGATKKVNISNDFMLTAGSTTNIKSAGHYETADVIHNNGVAAQLATDAITAITSAITARVPQHEPWPQHENINPLVYTPDLTVAVPGQGKTAQTNSYPPFVDDTFSKSNFKNPSSRNKNIKGETGLTAEYE